MRAILSLNVIRVHTEHSYVQQAFMKAKDNDHVLWSQITKGLANCQFYKNHFTLDTEEGIVIGYNDGTLYLGMESAHLEDSKSIELETPVRIRLAF